MTLRVLDANDRLVPRANNTITFSVSGPGELVATANGDPTNRVVFSSTERAAFSGKAISIVRSLPGQSGEIVLTASASGVAAATTTIVAD